MPCYCWKSLLWMWQWWEYRMRELEGIYHYFSTPTLLHRWTITKEGHDGCHQLLREQGRATHHWMWHWMHITLCGEALANTYKWVFNNKIQPSPTNKVLEKLLEFAKFWTRKNVETKYCTNKKIYKTKCNAITRTVICNEYITHKTYQWHISCKENAQTLFWWSLMKLTAQHSSNKIQKHHKQ